MKVSIKKEVLTTALSSVISAVSRRPTSSTAKKSALPILHHVAISCGEGGMRIGGTDLDRTVVSSVQSDECDISEHGEICIPGHELLAIAKRLKAGSVIQIDTTDVTATISSGRAVYNLPVLPAGTFPEMATPEWSHEFEVEAGTLKWAIERVINVIDHTEFRLYLRGMYMEIGNDKLRFVGTNGHILSMSEIDEPGGLGGFCGAIIPKETALLILKVLASIGGDDIVRVRFDSDPSKVQVDVDGICILSKLIGAEYPDYRRVIPANAEKVAVFSHKELTDGMACVTAIADSGKPVKFSINGECELTIANRDGRTSSDFVGAETFGIDIELGINTSYMANMLTSIEGEEVTLSTQGGVSGSATVWRGSDGASMHVIMPMDA